MAIANISGNILTDSGVSTSSLVSGSGTTSYVPKFTGTSTIGNSLIWDNGTNVGIGNTNTTYTLDVSGTGRFTGSLNVGGSGHTYLTIDRLAYDYDGVLAFKTTGTSKWLLGQRGVFDNNFYLYSYGTSSNVLTIANSTGAATFSGFIGVGGATANYPITAYISANGTSAAFGGTAYGIRIDNGGSFSSGRSTIYGVDASFYGSYQPLSIEASVLCLQTVTGGNVLIGTTTDTGYKLQANGGIVSKGSSAILYVEARDASTIYGFYAENSTYLYFYNTLGANVTGQFTRATGVYIALSDVNKKKDFENSTIGLNAILGLKTTLYRMKEDE